MTERLRRCVPEPHDLLQGPHADQSVTWQSTGQRPSLHFRCCVFAAQAAPPFCAGVEVATRVCVPTPHETLHAVVDHAGHVSWQSLGHACVLHERFCSSDGQILPPHCAARVSVRLRVCTPLPHDALHSDQSPNSPIWQSIAQAVGLHDDVSTRSPAHESPPCDSWRAMPRERDVLPPPHEAEQALQVLQAPNAQLTGQRCSLHTS